MTNAINFPGIGRDDEKAAFSLLVYHAFVLLLVFCRGLILLLRHRILFGRDLTAMLSHRTLLEKRKQVRDIEEAGHEIATDIDGSEQRPTLTHRRPFGRWDQADDMEKATNDAASDTRTTLKVPLPSLHFYGPLDHVPACDNFPQVMHIKDYVALASGSVDRSNDPFTPTAQLGCIDWFFNGPIVFSALMLVLFFNQTYSQQGGPLIAARRAWAAFRITICLDLVLIGRAYWRMHTRRSWVDRGPWNGVTVFEKGKVLTRKTKTIEENGSIRGFNGGGRIRVRVKQS